MIFPPSRNDTSIIMTNADDAYLSREFFFTLGKVPLQLTLPLASIKFENLSTVNKKSCVNSLKYIF
jgi:hypothetical protein